MASLGLAVFPLTANAQTQSVTIGWSPGSSTAAGYIVQYGTDGTNYGSQVNAGSNFSATIAGLAGGTTYYFEIVAYDTNNQTSAPTAPVVYTTAPNTNTVITTANPSNGGTVTGAGSFAQGNSVTVTATAGSGYSFVNWTENGVVQSAATNYIFTLTSNCTLVANFSTNVVNYSVAAQASPAGAGSITGAGTYGAGSSVTVTATANSGYTFSNWTENGAVQSSSASYNFTLANNRNLVANFSSNQVTYGVAIQSYPSGAGTLTGGGNFAAGTPVTVTAAAASGYTFSNWTEKGVVQATSSSYAFTLSANRNLVANFSTNTPTYTVIAQVNPIGAGVVTGNGTYAAGSGIVLSATANSGFTFTNWTQNGVALSTFGKYSFSLTTNCTVTANFVRQSVVGNTSNNPAFYTVTATASTNGNLSPSGPQSVGAGSNITFNATPATNYEVGQWSVNGAAAQSGGAAFTLQNVSTNEAVTVTFNALPAPTNPVVNTNFSFSISGNGAVTPKTTSFQYGKTYTLTASATKGSIFADWTSNGTVAATTARYTFMVESNFALVASFVSNPFPALAGTYRGLFYNTNGATEDTSGSITATVSASGAFTARQVIPGHSYSYSGRFSANGLAVKTISRPGLNPLTVQLQLDSTNQVLTGSISDGISTMDLAAVPAGFSRTKHASQAGKYTLLVPGSTNIPVEPGGNGIGTMSVSATGALVFSGTLADGTPISGSTAISRLGQWPLYVSLYGGKGSILGWLGFSNGGFVIGQTGWFKLPQAASKYYPGGFTNAATVMGSVYQYTNGMPPLPFNEGLLSLADGDLSQQITNEVALTPGFAATGGGGPSLTFRSSSGLFKATVADVDGKPIAVNGVVLQAQNLGAGFFLGTNESGSAVLSPAQ